MTGLAHKFPRKDTTPHTPDGKHAPAAHPSVSRNTTVVRIPLRSAKHHYGVSVSRGSRPYNEDSHQAGVIELPAFSRKAPTSVTLKKNTGEGTSADGASGDPQVFYFGVFDGHGGAECSDFLRESLHEYIEKAAEAFHLKSSLQRRGKNDSAPAIGGLDGDLQQQKQGQKALDAVELSKDEAGHQDGKAQSQDSGSKPYPGDPPLIQNADQEKIKQLERELTRGWKDLVGGYFRRFKPAYFSIYSGYQKLGEESDPLKQSGQDVDSGAAIEEVMTYAFLKADYDFVAAQAAKHSESRDVTRAERPLNDGDILGEPSKLAAHIGGPKRFKGGSTCSVAMVSTPTPTPFWNPATTSSLLVAHVGDTRILLCSTATGAAIPLTTNHHPSSPVESNRLRRYAASFVTDSFGEERISGLANTRAFGDIASKRIGVSAEPEIKRVEVGPAEYSFMVLMSDGVSGTLEDQEVVDVIKEAKTPEQAARDVVNFATEVSTEGDNATCLVVRMGGWERRQEGGHGSLGTKEARDFKRQQASDPRSRRQ
ncbi:Protein phosphatase 2C domain containing protein [Cladophialophora carrionii]|uniref:Protein phosphatase 2C domain containing protein n=1 Tax=Cladophialophora carrionii TaxID=86049 RepID=A0A1C1CAT5_9EURO|nr:Protein phosphatase 2C domain containing protein [Cladophialophora carrionii]